jgi:hypothetical protein
MRYCNWQAISATSGDRLISLVLKANKRAASRLYQVVWRQSRDDHFSGSQTSLRKITAAFSPRLRIFPQKIPPLRAYNGKNAVKTRSFAVLGSGTEIALA